MERGSLRFRIRTPLSFDIIREYEDGLETIAKGTCEPGFITILDEPIPPPESVFATGTTTNFVLFDDIYGLPLAPDESFNITAVFTSVTVDETKNAPLVVVEDQEL